MFYAQSTGGFYTSAINGDNIPVEAVEITTEEHSALLSGQSAGLRIVADISGRPILQDRPSPTQEQLVAQYESALDSYLDAVASAHRYNDRFTFALRAGYSGPYQSEGAAFALWMDTCNVQAFALLGDVLSGEAELPTVDDFIAALPEFVLP